MRILLAFFLSFSLISPAFAPLAAAQNALAPIFDLEAIHHPAIGRKGMVTSQEAVASQIGADILAQGGNAVDAAVAVGFALAVTLPRAGNLGGGGFMLVHLADGDRDIAIDYREMAPAAASRDMFLGPDGNVDPQKARFSYLSSGVPGTVAGLVHALDAYGTMKLKDVIAPAIKLAEEGLIVSDDMAAALDSAKGRLMKNAAAKAIFLPGGAAPRPGSRFRQTDLAWSLKQIAKHGKDGFYKGELADRLVADMKAHDGLITHEDLDNYAVKERQPVIGDYRGHRVVAMPPPSSGGVHVIQILNTIESDDLRALGQNSAAEIHLLAEAMKYAYADRSKYLGDPDFYDVPVAALTDKAYGRALRARIDMGRARPSSEISPAKTPPYESDQTTHFSVMDKYGNAVANTYTLNFSFGSGHVAKGTGILLNNEMDDFSSKPGAPNAFGLIGGEANAIEARKRPLSSMTPVIVMKGDEPYLVTGSPGGSTIITVVLQMIVNVIDFDLNVMEATARPRVHHQWLPDRLMVEPGLSPDTIALLKAKGHNPYERSVIGAAQSIVYKNGFYYGAADPRRPASRAVGVN